jgi:hypothetical protein
MFMVFVFIQIVEFNSQSFPLFPSLEEGAGGGLLHATNGGECRGDGGRDGGHPLQDRYYNLLIQLLHTLHFLM